jgi:hypothetical protein
MKKIKIKILMAQRNSILVKGERRKTLLFRLSLVQHPMMTVA